VIYLVLKSYFLLVRVDITLRKHGFKRLYDAIRERPTGEVPERKRIPSGRLCYAIDVACVFYPKTVLCLQRSAAAVFLLRSFGWPLEFVTGCAIGTFENHAWAELAGQIVTDKPYMYEMYQVLDRC
jgi:Transglutaminase-like superfamily